MNKFRVKTNMQVSALEECADLECNGYQKVFFYTSDRLWLMKLHHLHNGRTLTVTWKPDGYKLKEGSLILKEVGTWF